MFSITRTAFATGTRRINNFTSKSLLHAGQKSNKSTLVLVRHGESTWNLENKFTGWYDCPLSPKGESEVIEAGRLIKAEGLKADIAHTSLLKRAIKTLFHVMDETDQLWVPTVKSWELNERHYGSLQGLDKQETVDKYGKDQVLVWRRSYDVPPPVVDKSSPHHPSNDPRYASHDFPEEFTESLATTLDRVLLLREEYCAGSQGGQERFYYGAWKFPEGAGEASG